MGMGGTARDARIMPCCVAEVPGGHEEVEGVAMDGRRGEYAGEWGSKRRTRSQP